VILIPVKNLSSAKQRLASVLDQPSRTALAQAMLYDVLTTLHNWKNSPMVAVVTGDPYAVRLATDYQFEVIPDPDNPGETGAIEMATRICVERGTDSTLVIPADIPLIQAWELEEILKHAPAEGSVLAPAADGRGTNAAFRRPADLFPLRFGNDSFKPHHAAAQATGKACVILNLPGIAVDVDNPAELQQLISLPGDSRAQRLARQYAAAAAAHGERDGVETSGIATSGVGTRGVGTNRVGANRVGTGDPPVEPGSGAS
jgi:2-phospho-L-lactate guanylyltransferase